MKMPKRLLSISIITLGILTLLFAFGYVNSMVSYKYEVQDSLLFGSNPTRGLDDHQKQIIYDISASKYEAIGCGVLFCIAIVLKVNERRRNIG